MNPDLSIFEIWLRGLMAAAIGGAASAVAAIQFSPQTGIDWHQVGALASVGALLSVAHYLMPSPISNSTGDKK